MIESSIANRVTGQFEKDILKVGENRAEISNPDSILGQTMNHLGDEIVAATPNRESASRCNVIASTRGIVRKRSAAVRSSVARTTVRSGQCRLTRLSGAVDVDDASVFDDCYPVAQPLGFLHEMSGQENRLAALADAAHQIPDGAPRLRVKSRG